MSDHLESEVHNDSSMLERNMASGILVFALVVAAAAANAFFTVLFWSLPIGRSHLYEFYLCVATGALIAQPCLLSIWCFLLDQRFVIRVPLSMGILLGLTCFYISVTRGLDGGNGMPGEVILILLSIPYACVLITGIPMLILRFVGRRAISCRDSRQSNIESAQYGIRHLFFLMFVIAVLFPIAQQTFAGLSLVGGGPWIEIIGFVTLFCLLTCLQCMLSLALVFHPESRLRIAALTVVSTLVAPALVIWILITSTTIFGQIEFTYLVNASGFAASLAITQCAVLATFYRLGYRMRHLGTKNQ